MTSAILICAALLVHQGDARDIDGDTFWARCDGAGEVKIRLADVEAAERGLPCRAGRVAQMASTSGLWARVEGHRLRVEVAYPSYDRLVARVEADGRDVGADMLAAGLLRPWPHDAAGREIEPGSRPTWCEEGRGR